jgi:8-oxo-dGTP pyrophosphatase MutT (NUDIX family)
MNASHQPALPLPAATVLLLRERDERLEVFMVRRNSGMAFMPGALVFPGGRVDIGDCDRSLRPLCGDVGDISDRELAYRVAAVREAFEEAGVLLARDETGAFVCGKRLDQLAAYRPLLEKDQITVGAFLREEKLTLACDAMAFCAHWVTPKDHRMRFDTHFFVAPTPDDHLGAHDGWESVDSLWVSPAEVLAQQENAEWYLLPPTEVNLRLLLRSQTVDGAIALARSENIPQIGDGGDPRFPDVKMRMPPHLVASQTLKPSGN